MIRIELPQSLLELARPIDPPMWNKLETLRDRSWYRAMITAENCSTEKVKVGYDHEFGLFMCHGRNLIWYSLEHFSG